MICINGRLMIMLLQQSYFNCGDRGVHVDNAGKPNMFCSLVKV